MDRLPHLINTEKKFSVVNNLVRYSWDYTLVVLALSTREIVRFY
jgi:hypothetical protein